MLESPVGVFDSEKPHLKYWGLETMAFKGKIIHYQQVCFGKHTKDISCATYSVCHISVEGVEAYRNRTRIAPK